ncbi:hypothetical protein L484_010592 [Morus notabilis]|uniref:Uncharacterized protein n=1 Tax=Morus notabilis TaxID=981085 RepID=W9QDZ2_9ROSA|nr:hypothetical protein L484_010592 [Morus notabilis]
MGRVFPVLVRPPKGGKKFINTSRKGPGTANGPKTKNRGKPIRESVVQSTELNESLTPEATESKQLGGTDEVGLKTPIFSERTSTGFTERSLLQTQSAGN